MDTRGLPCIIFFISLAPERLSGVSGLSTKLQQGIFARHEPILKRVIAMQPLTAVVKSSYLAEHPN